jgi:hypothetical protein
MMAIAFMLMFFPHAVFAEKVLYDEFATGRIDPDKWTHTEFTREADPATGKLVSKIGTHYGTAENLTRFVNPGTINSIECQISVEDVQMIAEATTFANAWIELVAYNAQASGSGTGDVKGAVGFMDDGTGLAPTWVIFEAQDDEHTDWTVVGTGPVSVGALSYKTQHTLKLEYLGGRQFRFTINGVSQTVNGPAFGSVRQMPGAALATSISSESGSGKGYIHALFDQVYTNNSVLPYDTFGVSPLDASKWLDKEFVREISDGKLRLGVHGCDDWKDSVTVMQNDADYTGYLAATVKVESGSDVDTGSEAYARIGGYFYNTDYGPGSGKDYLGKLGDVWAEIQLVLDDNGELTARAEVVKALDSAFESEAVIYDQEFSTLSLSLDTEYELSIELGSNQLVFKCAGHGMASGVPPPGNRYEPRGKRPSVKVRVKNDPTECGRIKATFDHVIVGRNKSLYDEFAVGPIMPPKWQRHNDNQYDTARMIDTAAQDLKLYVNGCEKWQTASLSMQSPYSATDYLRADMMIETGSFVDPWDPPFSGVVRIGGFFYNSDNDTDPYNGRYHDVWAEVRIRLNSDGQLSGVAQLERMESAIPSTVTVLLDEAFSLPINFDTYYTVSIKLNEAADKMVFNFDGEVKEYNITTNIRQPSGYYKALMSRVFADSGLCGYVRGRFDNIYYNDEYDMVSLFDDFSGTGQNSGPLVNSITKWNEAEWTRLADDGKLLMQTFGCNQQERNRNNLKMQHKNYLASIVSIGSGSFLESGISGKARIAGYFYNDNGPPYNKYQNDVFVQTYLELDGGGTLTAHADAWRSDDPHQQTGTGLFHHNFGTFAFDVEHLLTIRFTGPSIVFSAGPHSTTFNLGSKANPPYNQSRGMENRVSATTGKCGYLEGSYDDVRIRYCDLDPIQLTYNTATMYCDDLRSAYAAAADGDILKVQSEFFWTPLHFDLDKSVTLLGGRSCNFLSKDGITRVIGPVAITAGTVTVENLEIY